MLFVNTTHPFLRIYDPASGQFIAFAAGKLDISEGDPGFGAVLAEAQRNPYISIHEKAATCPECGESFTGKIAPVSLANHRKSQHAGSKGAVAGDETRMVKAQATFVCDQCSPVQTFPNENVLGTHTRLLHAAAPKLTESGETVGGDEGGGVPVNLEIPAARGK